MAFRLYQMMLYAIETLTEAYGKGLLSVMMITVLVVAAASGFVLIGEEVGGWPLVMLGAAAVYIGWRGGKKH